jgi:hypothetical protein
MGQYTHLFVGNLYNVAAGSEPYLNAGQSVDIQVDEEVGLATSSFDPTVPALPTVPLRKIPGTDRTVFEVTAGASTATIQAAIQNAVNVAGTRPVVHLQSGSYNITSTLTIPANCDLTLIGDGTNQGTFLNWTGGGTGPMLQITGPCSAQVRELEFWAAGGAHGLVLQNVDQADSQILCSDLQLNGYTPGGSAAYRFQAIENADIWLQAMQGTSFDSFIHVTGSTVQNSGTVTANRIGTFMGAVGENGSFYSVTNGARLVARSIYNEIATAGQPTVISMTGKGYLAMDGHKLGYYFQPTPPAFNLNGLDGELVVMGGKTIPRGTDYARIIVQGNGTNTKALFAGFYYQEAITGLTSDTAYSNTSSPAAVSGFILPTTHSSGLQTVLPDRGTTSAAHIRSMLRMVRSWRPCLAQPAVSGKTTIVLHRFRITAGPAKDAVRITA